MKALRRFLLSRKPQRYVATASACYLLPETRGRGKRRRAKSRSVAASLPELGGAAVRLLPYLLVATLAAGAPALGYVAYVELLTSPYFSLSEVVVEGNSRMSAAEVAAASGVQIGDNVLSIDEETVVERLRYLPWAESVEVERELPDRLVIRVRERVPAAVLVEEGSFLVDDAGYLFKELEPRDLSSDLLVISGVNAQRRIRENDERRAREIVSEALGIVQRYRERALDRYKRVVEVGFDERFGFTLVCAGGERFEMGFCDYTAKLARLEVVLADLAGRGSPLEVVRLDNEKHPEKVTVAGTRVHLESVPRILAAPAGRTAGMMP
ncbi:MAG: FtsQ-type POTRA domain-containing protein [Deltaproteobacteria bacterium]|nr:FtsQ-type POTRA domain-containing protein [Deltaproteobacteria bacterium]